MPRGPARQYYVPPNRTSIEGGRPQYHGLFENNHQPLRRPLPSPQLAFAAAMQLKRRTNNIKSRLGFFGYHPGRGRGRRWGRGGGRRWGRPYRRPFRRSQSLSNLNRWNSTHSLASDGMGRKSRGRKRSFSFSGRGGRGGQRQPPITKEELDDQLDTYMANTKTVLDKDLDDYMSQSKM